VAALGGLRLGEILGLQWRDLDLEAATLHVRHSLDRGELQEPKSDHSIRDVDIPASLVKTLREYRLAFPGPKKATNFVFANAESGPLDPNNPRWRPLDPDNLRKRIWYPFLVRAELPKIRLHDLRHTYASMLIARGESVIVVRDLLGHSSAQVTLDIYSHLWPNSRAEAAAGLESLVFGGQAK